MTITQPTASVNTSAGTVVESATCFAPEHLREYLGGWCDDAQAAAVETHLLACPNCERTVRELEFKPDTLLQSLQGTTAARSVPNRETSNAELVSDAAVDVARFEDDREREGSRFETNRATKAALEKVKQLMDVPHQTAADKEKAAWQPANREIGIYELLKPLGRGGMGAVYLANHRQLKKQVAIKLLPIMSAEDSDVRARFQREIRVVGRLNHPSIVAATDAGEIDGTQFLVMEYVPGLDLSRLARLLGKLPVADACELIRQVALGLSCAHAEGVVHRDVKPSNLMLDETGHIRILDFGLAQLSFWDEASVDLTTVGQLMGTLDYMAPEQAEFGGNVDYRADLYALGATLFRLLCGRPPLAAAPNQSPLEKLRLLANHQPPKLDTLCPEAPPGLVALVGSLLSRSPQDRPASAAHVAEQLGAFTESANLVGLLKRAQSKAAESPQLLKPEKLGLEKGVWNFGGIPAASATPDAGEFQTPFSRRIRRWLLAAAMPLLIVAGILIKLETDKGQLVIESDIDNIKVQIVSNGQPVSGLTINHGTTATRLRADKYEVIIDGPSDGLTIENEHFTLKNGETVVAKIQMSPIPSVKQSSSAPVIGREKTLDQASIRAAAARLSDLLETFSERMPLSLLIQMTDSKNSVKTAEDLGSRVHSLLECVDQKHSEHEVIEHLGEIEFQGSLFLVKFKDLPNESAQSFMKEIEIELINLRFASLGSNTRPSTDSRESPTNNVSTEPLYEGKTLSEWLDMLSRERSPKGLKSAFDACSALVSPETSERITQTILKTVPLLDGEMRLMPGRDSDSTSLDGEARKVLLKANSGTAFYELWVREFDAGDESWRKRLWRYAIYGQPDAKSLEPFVVWAERRLKSAPTEVPSENEVTLNAAIYLRGFASSIYLTNLSQPDTTGDSAFSQRVLTALKSSPLLGISWWLSQPLVRRTYSDDGIRISTDTNLWPAAIKAEITKVAIETLERDDSPPVLVAQACMILANGAELNADERSRILTAVNRRLIAACAQPETMRDKAKTDGEFQLLSTPDITSPTFTATYDTAAAYLMMEFLDVVKMLNGRTEVSQGLSDLLGQVQASRDLLNAANELRPSQGNRNIGSFPAGFRGFQLKWPDLTTATSDGSPQNLGAMMVMSVWGNHSPTFTNWFDYCILQHRVMQDYLASIEKPATNAQPAEVAEPLPQ